MAGQGVRLDKALVQLGLVTTRSQAESYIRLGRVRVSGRLITKSGYFVHDLSLVELDQPEQFVFLRQLELLRLLVCLEASQNGSPLFPLFGLAQQLVCLLLLNLLHDEFLKRILPKFLL